MSLSLSLWDSFAFLPPANEVRGKVMFLLTSVILSTRGGSLCMMSLPVWLPDPMFLPGGICLWGGPSWTEMDRDTPVPYDKEWAVHILLECILVRKLNREKLLQHFRFQRRISIIFAESRIRLYFTLFGTTSRVCI